MGWAACTAPHFYSLNGYEEQEFSERTRDSNTRIARVVGRISFYLDLLKPNNELQVLRATVERTSRRVSYFDEIVSTDESEDIRYSCYAVGRDSDKIEP